MLISIEDGETVALDEIIAVIETDKVKVALGPTIVF